MNAEDWMYVRNQILTVTENRHELLTEIASDTWPKLTYTAAQYAPWVPVKGDATPAYDLWMITANGLASAEATYALATASFENKLNELTVQPNPDTNSKGVQWDSIVSSNVALNGPIYNYLLPNGRSGWSGGTYQQRLDYISQFGERLAEQTTKPALVTLGTEVTAFHTAAKGLRDAQTEKEGIVTEWRAGMEPARVGLCRQLHGIIGFGIYFWRDNPVTVATLFDLELFRESGPELPEPPADSTWTAATRTLSTTALPPRATRLELWREGPGGAPERLLIGDAGALALTVPATFTFFPGETYQLWLQGRNGAGSSTPGPKQTWVAT